MRQMAEMKGIIPLKFHVTRTLLESDQGGMMRVIIYLKESRVRLSLSTIQSFPLSDLISKKQYILSLSTFLNHNVQESCVIKRFMLK